MSERDERLRRARVVADMLKVTDLSPDGQADAAAVEWVCAALLAARRERDALRDAAKLLLMLLDEWAWTAHHTVQSPGIKATVAQDDMIRRRNELWALVAAATDEGK
jgi:hypothetical protein